jgi:hypothetical protein
MRLGEDADMIRTSETPGKIMERNETLGSALRDEESAKCAG